MWKPQFLKKLLESMHIKLLFKSLLKSNKITLNRCTYLLSVLEGVYGDWDWPMGHTFK